MKLKDLVERIDGLRIYTAGGGAATIPDLDVASVSCNSRENLSKSLFVAVKGSQADGHAFIQDALCRGAAAIVFEDARWI